MFTQTHIAEIRELLRLKAETKKSEPSDKSANNGSVESTLPSYQTIKAKPEVPLIPHVPAKASTKQPPKPVISSVTYTDYYQLKNKTKVCPFDGVNMKIKPQSVDCFDGKKRKLNFLCCSSCSRKFIFNLGQAIDLRQYAVTRHEIPDDIQLPQSPVVPKQPSQANGKANSLEKFKLEYTLTLSVGDQVYSSVYGRGTVTAKRTHSSSYIVTVSFKDCTQEFQEDIALSSGTLKKM